MYLKFTRLDGSPIWINSAFIVTVEPRRQGGGSIVVPIGDGLDYDVRENCDKVLAMLGAAPEPEVKVVPVPAPKGLAPTTPDDISPEREENPPPPAGEANAQTAGEQGEAQAKKRRRRSHRGGRSGKKAANNANQAAVNPERRDSGKSEGAPA